MNEENKTLTEDTTPDTAAEQTPDTAEEKTFTQAEVDEIISKRLARAAKGTPTAEEMKEFKAWKKAQQTESEKFAELDAKYRALQEEHAAQMNLQAVKDAGANADFADIIADRVAKMDGDDFEKNLTEYKKKNPQYFGGSGIRVQSSAPSVGGSVDRAKTTNDLINEGLRTLINK